MLCGNTLIMSFFRLGAKVALASFISFPVYRVPEQRCHSFKTMLQYRIMDGQLRATGNVRFGSIVLKKSAMVSAAEKYASEIEIFTFVRGFQTQISRSSV
jgi:hypothetical protein